jgi:membrane protease YdiL (CAAX protease family)
MEPPISPEPVPPLPLPSSYAVTGAPLPRTVHGIADVVGGVASIWLANLLLMVVAQIVRRITLGARGEDDALTLAWAPVDGVLTLAMVWLFACRRHRRSPLDALGLAPAPVPVMLGAAALGLVGAASFRALLGLGLGGGKTPMQQWVGAVTDRPAGGLLLLALVIAMAAIEEVYYRGFVFPAVAARWGSRRATLLVAGWFALVHVPQLWGNWVAVALVGAMGTAITLLRARTGSVLPGLAAHLVYNAALAVPLALRSLARLTGKA